MAGLALLCLAQPAFAGEGALDLISPETLTLTGDVRAVATDGEGSWVDGNFGKLRYGGTASGAMRVRPELGEAALVWQPRFGWSLKGTVVAVAAGGPDTTGGLSEAFLSFKPLSDGNVKFSARAGLMWPQISLEHSGADWAVTDTITPSAINSWVGEEVKVVGIEATVAAQLGGHNLSGTIGGFDANDTAGTLLAFRGWALHDRKALVLSKHRLPPQNAFITQIQPPFTHPVLDLDPGIARRPGYYARVAWQPPVPLKLEYFHYDNNGDPTAVNNDLEWGWRTKFHNIGLSGEIAGKWQIRAQAMSGQTRMGFPINGKIWVDTKFRSAYGMVTRHFDKGAVSLRGEAFGTRNSGSALTRDDDEDGWAITAALRRNLGEHVTALAEYLHVESTRQGRSRAGVAPQQTQNQLQLSLRLQW